jgi:hypothetical protein
MPADDFEFSISGYLFAYPFTFSAGIYTEEARDRLYDPLATWKIQGANSCRLRWSQSEL